MKRKYIIAALILVFMMILTSCGSSGASENPVDTASETKASEQAVAEEELSQQDTEQTASAKDPSDIGPEKVKQIVLAKVPGAMEESIYEFEREIDDGRVEYEGSMYHDGYEYEFEVDGATGNILQWEIDD